MKKINRWLLFFVCVAIFLALRIHSLSKTHPPVTHKIDKPLLPPPITIAQDHPWLQIQPTVKGAAMEIVRDFEKIRQLSSSTSDLSEKEITSLLIEHLLALQASIPFTFPESLYNVLCITESPVAAPAPFHVFKRLYLGETELGLPFYLDVRVFELDSVNAEEIIAWHLNILDGSCVVLSMTKERQTFLCQGQRSASAADTTHGFAVLQGERGLFLDFYEKDNKLYVCYAEAPQATFNQHAALLIPFPIKNIIIDGSESSRD